MNYFKTFCKKNNSWHTLTFVETCEENMEDIDLFRAYILNLVLKTGKKTFFSGPITINLVTIK